MSLRCPGEYPVAKDLEDLEDVYLELRGESHDEKHVIENCQKIGGEVVEKKGGLGTESLET